MKLLHQNKIQIFIFLGTFALLFHIFIRGYNPQDEGWVLYGAWRIFEGSIPYKDFQYLYTPLTAFLGALSFLIFDVSILSERLIALLIASFTSVVLYNFFQNLKISSYFSILLVGYFVVWGPLQTNYLSPAIVSIELGIFYLYFMFNSFQSKEKSNIFAFITGIFVPLIILTKQNFGAAIFLHALIVGFFLMRQRHQNLKYFIAGSLIPAFIFSFYLIATTSFDDFIYEMYSFLILDAATGGFTYHTPLTYPAPILYKAAKIILYALPLAIPNFLLYFFVRQKSKIFLIPLLLVLFYFAGIQPVIDTIHVTPLIAFSAIGTGLFSLQIRNKKLKLFMFSFICILIVVGIYNGIYRNYFKWFAPLYTNTGQIESKHAKILIEPNDALAINSIVSYITQHSNSDESIFNYGMTPIFYFLSARQSPSKFNTIETRNVQGENLEILLQEFELNPPHLIVSDGEFRNINPRVELFILENYERTATVGGRTFYKPI